MMNSISLATKSLIFVEAGIVNLFKEHLFQETCYNGYFRLYDMQYSTNIKEVKLYQVYSISYNPIEKDLVL